MQVTCPACSTRYTTDDAKVRGKTVRMRCRACDTVWLVQGPGREDAPPVSQRQEHQDWGPPPEQQVERRAAVVKRGTERERRDLFASQQLDEGSVRQTLRPPPPGSGLSGARSEDSVLFTVDSLRAAARVETPKPVRAPEPPKSDDEGIIDLVALSQRPPAASPFGPVTGVPSEPPGGFAREVLGSAAPASAQPKKRGRFGIVAGSLGAAAVAVASAVLLFGGDIPRRATHATAPVAAVSARAAAVGTKAHEAETAKLEAERKDEAKATAEASAKNDAKRTTRGGKVRWGAPARGGASTARASAPAAPKAPAADACGCKGNFDCVIRCSAKGK